MKKNVIRLCEDLVLAICGDMARDIKNYNTLIWQEKIEIQFNTLIVFNNIIHRITK